jgi:hypothetical protein
VVDYLARRLAVDWLSYTQRAAIGVFTISELAGQDRRQWCDPPGGQPSPLEMFADVQRSRRWPAAGGMTGDTSAR